MTRQRGAYSRARRRRYSPLRFLRCIYLRSSPKRAQGRGCIAGRDRGPARWFRGRDSVLTCFDKRAPLYGRHETPKAALRTQSRQPSRRVARARPRWPRFVGRGKFSAARSREMITPAGSLQFTTVGVWFQRNRLAFCLSAVPRGRDGTAH